MASAGVDPLSFFGQEIKEYLNVQNIKLYLVKAEAITADEYEEIDGEDYARTPRKAAEKLWSILRRKSEGLDKLQKALEANVASEDCHDGHRELIKILRGPAYDYDKVKSLLTSVSLSSYEIDCAVSFLLRLTLSQGVSLLNSSILQGTVDWKSLLSRLERFHLCHCYDVDLLEHLLDSVQLEEDEEEEANPVQGSIRRCLSRMKSDSNYLVSDAKGHLHPTPGCFSFAVQLANRSPLMTSDLYETKKAILEEFGLPLFSFQFIGVVQGVLYYQIPLHFLDAIQGKLASVGTDRVHLQKASITTVVLRSDCIFDEYSIKPGAYSHDIISSNYKAVYTSVPQALPGGFGGNRSSTKKSPGSPRLRSAVSERSHDRDKDKSSLPGHSNSHSSITPRKFRSRISASWSPQITKAIVCKHEHTLTFVMLGSKTSGKSSILNCFVEHTSQLNGLAEKTDANGIDVRHKIIPWNAFAQVKICVWKVPSSYCSNHSNFSDLHFTKNANAFIFVGDLTNDRYEESLVSIKDLKGKVINRYKQASKPSIPTILVMNKMDGLCSGGLKGGKKHTVETFVKDHNFTRYFLTSAKLGLKIKSMFEWICATILNADAEGVQFHAKS